jgi:Flp pilus assembly pilin Flp
LEELIAAVDDMAVLRAIFGGADNEAGATAIEYAFVALLISISGAGLLTQMGGTLVTIFTTVGDNL